MAPEVDWRGAADLGNHLRHAYDAVDIKILWRICVDDLGPLERAVDAMIAAYGPMPSPPPSP